MNTTPHRNRIFAVVAGVVAVGTLGLASNVSASGNGDGQGSGNGGRISQMTDAQKCDAADRAFERAAKLDKRLHAAIDRLTKLQQKAEAKGRTEVAARLGQRIDKAEAALKALEQKVAKAHTWVDQHCAD